MMNKIDLIIDSLSVTQNSVWSALTEKALAAARELKATYPQGAQVRPVEFAATVSAGVGADFVGMPMIWAEWPTRPEISMSPEHLPQYIATNNIKPTTEGGGGGGGGAWGSMSPIDQLKAVLCDPTGKCCIDGSDEDRAIIDRALQALAQPEQEPVAWMLPDYGDVLSASEADGTVIYNIPLYTAPPKPEQKSISTNDHLCSMLRQVHDVLACTALPMKRSWVGLTDEERHACTQSPFTEENYRAIEARLKEKNT